jgi:hypothetical protein
MFSGTIQGDTPAALDFAPVQEGGQAIWFDRQFNWPASRLTFNCAKKIMLR